MWRLYIYLHVAYDVLQVKNGGWLELLFGPCTSEMGHEEDLHSQPPHAELQRPWILEWILELIKYISELNIQPHGEIIMDSITTFSLSPPEFHEGSRFPKLVSFDNCWTPELYFFVAATFETWYFVQSPRRLQTLADLNVGPNESIHDHIRLRHYSA